MTPVLVLLGISSAALAQTNLETNAGIQFNFSTPGAANLALGGAFLALADDATAAYTNPAGLTNLLDPELHLETRSWKYTHLFTDRGRIEGRAPTFCEGTGIPESQCIDTMAGLSDGEAEDRVDGVSFLSYVHPRNKWVFAVYRHELVNFEANFRTQGAFLERTRGRSPSGIPGETDGRLASLDSRMDLEVVTFGFAAAFRPHERLSVGASVAYFDFALRSRTDRFVPPLYKLADFRADKVVNFQTQNGTDSNVGITLGISWESPNGVWSLGAVYRPGPAFDFRAESRRGETSTVPFVEAESDAVFHIPDAYGMGVALRPSDAVRVTLDVDRVEYGDLLDDFVDIFDLAALFPGDPPEVPPRDPELDRFAIDDVTELHVGFEYFFYRAKIPLLLRLGAWHDPDHSLRFEGKNAGFQAVFRQRDGQTHLSFGLGIARDRFQVDAGYDYADRVSTLALSATYHF